MHNQVWDGVTLASTIKPEEAGMVRSADAARAYDWGIAIGAAAGAGAQLDQYNASAANRATPAAPGRARRRAGCGGRCAAPGLGARRTPCCAQGQRPLEIAMRQGHHHLRELLTPVFQRDMPLEVLQPIQQKHFHALDSCARRAARA
ncbi:MAG: hypothetical protein U0Z44_20345 [Kouleothrix sp.]